MKWIIPALALSLTFTSCSDDSASSGGNYSKLTGYDWLIGKWEQKTDQGVIFETWIRVSDTEFAAASGRRTATGQDLVDETIRLVKRGDDVWYIPTVKDQNNGQPIPFKQTLNHADIYVFENPDHDFPSKIAYQHIAADKFIATISGEPQGHKLSLDLEFEKVK